MYLLLLLAVSAAPGKSNAVIWTGGTTKAEVEAKLAQWPKDEARWAARLKLQAGFPKLVKSDDVPGLKPGFHVVLLGICGPERVRARTRAIKELYPETYWRALTTEQPEACPELYCTATDDMVAVPGGNAVFGCTGAACTGQPAKSTRELASFEMDRTEVTRDAYARCVASKECSALKDASDDRVPAEATYTQAWAYCAAQGKRVVNDDEWEKAARGSDGRPFPWGARTPDCSMGHFSDCTGPLKPVASFAAWASPYGALDMFGNATEWTNGAPLDSGGKKLFPFRGEAGRDGAPGLWAQGHDRAEALHGFRCARACTWREGRSVPALPPPVDTKAEVDPAYASIADLELRAGLEAWRAARQKELGEGATVEWREVTRVDWDGAANYVRENASGVCMEGPIKLKLDYQTKKVEKTHGGAVACCGGKCGPMTPIGAAVRFVEAVEAHDAEKAKAFVGPKGYPLKSYLNGALESSFKVMPEDAATQAPDLRLDELTCDERFDDKGVAKCSSGRGELTLKKTKTGAQVISGADYEVEGC